MLLNNVSIQLGQENVDDTESLVRQAFEQYSDAQRDVTIKGAITAAGMTYSAVAAAGPIAAAVTIPLGMLLTYWNKKKYRDEAYAYFESLGMVGTPQRRYRGTLYQSRGGWRYPHGQLVADVIVEQIGAAFPEVTETQLNRMGLDALLTLREVRKEFPDVPLELAAEAILAMHGIYRSIGPAGEVTYELHHGYVPHGIAHHPVIHHGAHHTIIHHVHYPPKKADTDMLLVGGAVAALVLLFK